MKSFSTLFFLLVVLSTFSQSDNNVEAHQFKVNFINPGLEYEIGITKNQTIDLGAGLQFGANSFGYAFYPALNGQYRFYYNLDRRARKDKMTAGNSGNYIAASGTLFIEEVIIGSLSSGDGFSGFVGPVYGIQRTYPKGLNFSMEFGVGYYFDDFYQDDIIIGPTFSFSIGWVLRKTNK